jgi:cbb3-type cytochrome oxidase subunit 3
MFNKKNKKEKVEGKGAKYQDLLKKIEVYVSRYFDALVAVLVIIIFLLGAFFVINPKYKSIIEEEKYSQADMESERDILNNYFSKLNEYVDIYRKLSNVSRERVEKIIPEDDFLEKFFARMETLTKRQGVVLTEMMLAYDEEDDGKKAKKPSANDKKSLKKINIQISVSGVDYDGVKRLLKAFENNLRILDVNTLEFNITEKTASFSVTTYFLD